MESGALLDNGDGAADLAHRLEIAKQDHGVGEIGHVDGSLHISHEPVLRDRHECRRALAVQVLEEFMHVQNERVFLRHRGLIAVETVDDDCLIVWVSTVRATR